MRTYRTHKYGAKRTEYAGITFASKKEATRYAELEILVKLKQITDLQLQPKFPLYVANQKICTYVADFAYTSEGKRIVEDVKGMKTPVYRLKAKLFEALYAPLRISEI